MYTTAELEAHAVAGVVCKMNVRISSGPRVTTVSASLQSLLLRQVKASAGLLSPPDTSSGCWTEPSVPSGAPVRQDLRLTMALG